MSKALPLASEKMKEAVRDAVSDDSEKIDSDDRWQNSSRSRKQLLHEGGVVAKRSTHEQCQPASGSDANHQQLNEEVRSIHAG